MFLPHCCGVRVGASMHLQECVITFLMSMLALSISCFVHAMHSFLNNKSRLQLTFYCCIAA